YLLLLNSPVPTQASALSLHDALPISELGVGEEERAFVQPTAPAASAHFAVLRRGVEERRAVRCRYYAIGRDAEEERVIEPYGLMLSWGHWYCVGRSPERNAMRVFRRD